MLSMICLAVNVLQLKQNVACFNMITKKNKSRTLPELILCKCECKFGGRKCNLNQNWTNNKCWHEFKNPKENQFKKEYFWDPPKCSCKNSKYVRCIGDLVVICDQIIEETKNIPP